MNGLEVTVLLGTTVFAGAVLSPKVRMPAPLILLVLGLILGSVPELREIELPPEVVLLIFLPAMLFWESLTTSLRSIKRDFRGIVILSTLQVVVTAFAVAAVAASLGMPWEAALVLGAALAPPDATAVAAMGRSLPHRNFMLLKAESLTNDGTALVIYAIAVGTTVGGQYSALDVTGLVVRSYAGGLAAGAVVAGLAYVVLRRLTDAITINIGLLLTPFAAYLLAESIQASGVLAVVVAGLIVAFVSGRISNANSRRQTESAWPLASYLLNGSLFVLIGLEVQAVTHELGAGDIGRLTTIVVAVWIGLIFVRFLFQSVSVLLIRVLDRRPEQRARRMTYRARVVSAVAGFRGAISLAIALSVPPAMDNGRPFPGRDDIVFVTAGVIVLTLLVQGPLLPMVVRWAALPEDVSTPTETVLAEIAITKSAIQALPRLAREIGVSDVVRDRLADEYREHLRVVEERGSVSVQQVETVGEEGATGGAEERAVPGPESGSPGVRSRQRARLALALLESKRAVLIRLRHDGSIDDSVARQIQTQLDVEELRLTGVDRFE